MLRGLILSCSTGEGHNSAALAMAEACEDICVDYQVADGLSFMNKGAARIVKSSLNNLAVKSPRGFGAMYTAGSIVSSLTHHSPIYFANGSYAGNLLEYIEKNDFDFALCSHLFPAEALSYLKNKGQLKIPFYITATDYTCIPFWEELCPDAYFIPHEELRSECISKGIPSEKLICTGIPTKRNFRLTTPQSDARAMLGIPTDSPAFLVMTGGVGCGDAVCATRELLLRCEDCSITVLAGRNSQLREDMEKHFGSDSRVRTVVFTKQVNVFMDACDVLLTKAGGLSSTEAAVKNVPMVHVGAIPGCETKNAGFFEDHGMSVNAPTVEEAASAAVFISRSASDREKMLAAQRQNTNPLAARAICSYIAEDCRRKGQFREEIRSGYAVGKEHSI